MGALLLDPGSSLHAALSALAAQARAVFLAGLPGTGKSLLIHQLAQLAHARGRAVSLLQWDVARPVVEESEAARAFPARGGVTHGVVRVAVGRWARGAIARWRQAHHGDAALLIGETPLVGHRLVELVRPADDAAEPILSAADARFVIPVPSREVRRHLEGERERRAARPLHPREREDAPPHVLRDLWREIARVGAALRLAGPPAARPTPRTIPRCTRPSMATCCGGATRRCCAWTPCSTRARSRPTRCPCPPPICARRPARWRRWSRRPRATGATLPRSSARSTGGTPRPEA
jgi:hypothetical protein